MATCISTISKSNHSLFVAHTNRRSNEQDTSSHNHLFREPCYICRHTHLPKNHTSMWQGFEFYTPTSNANCLNKSKCLPKILGDMSLGNLNHEPLVHLQEYREFRGHGVAFQHLKTKVVDQSSCSCFNLHESHLFT